MKTVTFDEDKWQVVPKHPVNEMTGRVEEMCNIGMGLSHPIYEAMLSVAPSPPEEEEEVEFLRRDAERLEFLESESKSSHTGCSITYAKYSEGGRVIECGFRLMRFHKIGSFCKSVREAIDQAMQE